MPTKKQTWRIKNTLFARRNSLSSVLDISKVYYISIFATNLFVLGYQFDWKSDIEKPSE
jgi:hypothetical protein